MRRVPEWCAGYIGLPYKPGGRDRSGIDCWGLLQLVWREQFGIALPDYDGPLWERGASAAAVAEAAIAYSRQFVPVAPGAERCGDGVLFRMLGRPIHVAAVVEPGIMLHVDDSADSCIEEYTSIRWSRRIIGLYRYE
jgi:cell wall-associated NlpC family hydrolase